MLWLVSFLRFMEVYGFEQSKRYTNLVTFCRFAGEQICAELMKEDGLTHLLLYVKNLFYTVII